VRRRHRGSNRSRRPVGNGSASSPPISSGSTAAQERASIADRPEGRATIVSRLGRSPQPVPVRDWSSEPTSSLRLILLRPAMPARNRRTLAEAHPAAIVHLAPGVGRSAATGHSQAGRFQSAGQSDHPIAITRASRLVQLASSKRTARNTNGRTR
jgi:hypothetical protein